MNKRAKRIFLFFLNFNPLSPIRLERNHFEQANISRVGRGDVVHRARLADISAVYTSLRPTSSLSPLNAPPIPRLKENFFAAHASFAERKLLWTFAALSGSRGWGGGEEKTPLIRPISKNIPTVHDKTRFRSLTLFSLPSWYFSKNSSPLSIVSTAERKIFAKILASQNFINLYTSIDLGNLKDLGIWFRLSFDETIGNRTYSKLYT